MTETLLWIVGGSPEARRAVAGAAPLEDPIVVEVARTGELDGAEHVPADLTDPASWAALEAHLLARLGLYEGDLAVLVVLPPPDTGTRPAVVAGAAAPQVLGHGFLRAAAGFAGRSALLLAAADAAEGSAYVPGAAAVDHWARTVAAEQRRRGTATRVAAAPFDARAEDLPAAADALWAHLAEA